MFPKLSRAARRRLVALGIAALTASTIVPMGRWLKASYFSTRPETLLRDADKLAWDNAWIQARPLYREAEALFAKDHRISEALYARVSQVPAVSELSSTPEQIEVLTEELALPEAQDPETRLRILVIRGMLETNYDAGMARATWSQVEHLALLRQHYMLVARAVGEQGIASFILGDIGGAKDKVIFAWGVAKYLHDPAAQVRYASVYGAGLVELHRYEESLSSLDKAIQVATHTPGIAYPTIAIMAKIQALAGLGRQQEALALSDESMEWAQKYHLQAHLFELHRMRGFIFEQAGGWEQAIVEYSRAVGYARNISYWRGLTQTDGPIAQCYEHQGELVQALAAINEGIAANMKISDEIYFAPRNLAIKAEILARMGQVGESNDLYQKSADLIDSLLIYVPTRGVERELLSELSNVYSGYSGSLWSQNKHAEAFRVLEMARGRIESQALEHHELVRPSPHKPTDQERVLTGLNSQLLNSDDPKARARILDQILSTEQDLDDETLAHRTATHPVELAMLQSDLRPSELVVEYILDEPESHVLAITHQAIRRYDLPSGSVLNSKADQYRKLLHGQKTDPRLARELFGDLLGRVDEYRERSSLIVVPDGNLHLIPFAALMDGSDYVLDSHTVSVVPSGTVLNLLRRRDYDSMPVAASFPYLGVAAWTERPISRLERIVRGADGPDSRELVALPDSRHEVETIGTDLPKPDTILLGSTATETNFKQLPLERYSVLHLALHGYVDMNYPDRSALVFAPEAAGADDGLLQVREIRHLDLRAELVTLSACNTGVGPVGEEGVENLVNAFIEAGSKSVVSTLWELEDAPTSHLMIAFYKRLAAHEEKAQALREAQLELMSAGMPPYTWASFELVGEPSGSLFNSRDDKPVFRRSLLRKSYLREAGH